jgi:hypothetical protein
MRNDTIGVMQKAANMVYFKVLTWQLYEGTGKEA